MLEPQSSSALPPYYGSCDGILIPSYTAEPSVGEECLSRPSSSRHSRTGEFTKNNGRITLTLKEQPDHPLAPVYAPNDLVTGTISIQTSESVTEVVMKLFGRLDLAAANGGQQSELINDSYTVWNNLKRFPCPASIPFSFIFPSTYFDGARTWPLPPSIRITPSEKPFTHVKCVYTISVLVSTVLHPRFSLWRGEKSLSVTLNLRRTENPPRPIMPDTSLFSTVKTGPEEWCQILCEIKHIQNVHCSVQLYIPSALVYGLADRIPFHIQIIGPPAALRRLVHPTATTQNSVRVHLVRRVYFFMRENGHRRDIDIGEGVLSVLPPPISSLDQDSDQAAVDWAGVVQCDETVTVGGFEAGTFQVKDFVVVSIPAWNLCHQHGIRFVSDTWVDDAGPGDRV
ncbi:hypothetical protein B0H11DRAFT_1141732 [Mycena galericulata]|nr:hypothetical protein B0H11DRAFT_1141732 [Mycena galericulata]